MNPNRNNGGNDNNERRDWSWWEYGAAAAAAAAVVGGGIYMLSSNNNSNRDNSNDSSSEDSSNGISGQGPTSEQRSVFSRIGDLLQPLLEDQDTPREELVFIYIYIFQYTTNIKNHRPSLLHTISESF